VRRALLCLKVPRLRPLVLPAKAILNYITRMSMEDWCNDRGEKRSARIKTCTWDNFTTKYVIWTGKEKKKI
jgi:hypothetical protein